jgi:hypothetical protein
MSMALQEHPASHAIEARQGPPAPIDDSFIKTIQYIAASGYFGEARDEAKAAVKVLIGRELGIEPMAAMMGIDIIETRRGPRPRLSANIIGALIKRSGQFDYTYELSSTACKVTVWRKTEDGWGSYGTTSYSLEEARKAGLMRQGLPWDTYTQDMLFARAMSRTKRIVPHLFVGFSGTVEVILPEEVDDEGWTADQRKAIFAGLSRWEMDDAERHRWASAILGREITTFTEFTRADAQQLLAWLDDAQAREENQTPSAGTSSVGPSPVATAGEPAEATVARSAEGAASLATAGSGGPEPAGDAAPAPAPDPGSWSSVPVADLVGAWNAWHARSPKSAEGWQRSFLGNVVHHESFDECTPEEAQGGYEWLQALGKVQA